ncbi:hypothetical protein IFM89_007715 [Coptis chinensis]|uniref:DNA-binding protein RHL1 n=1 Tax=Coptis chinensis TaxID=261450 RepID=A0A835IXF9_9MAGN|nr:hypothetical protein IFM89_007715 [Coptis chinensis]
MVKEGASAPKKKQKVDKNDDERSRLKKLAFTRNILSQTPLKPPSTLPPSKTLVKHHGKDIVKKSQRKNRFLFSFPALLGPIKGGKIGELIDLGTKNPILYLDFPQGRVKLFGTILFSKNRYLTLQFSKGGKNVMCEDHFDNMVVFSDVWWIGTKDENPEEAQLEFPKNLIQGKHTDSDFQGGAGETCEPKPGVKTANKPRKEYVETQTPSDDLEDMSDDSGPLNGINKDLMEVTTVRHSMRTAGKKIKFTEVSSGEDSAGSISDTLEEMKEEVKEKVDDVTNAPSLVVHAGDSLKIATRTDLLGQNQESSFSAKSKEDSVSKHGLLVQATISSLFGKVKKKDESRKETKTAVKERQSGKESNTKKKQSKVENDDIEDFSSESEVNPYFRILKKVMKNGLREIEGLHVTGNKTMVTYNLENALWK